MPPDLRELGAGVRVAILDTGVDVDHQDLTECIERSYNFNSSLSDDLVDRDGHGTHVAGIIAGNGVSSRGAYSGLAPAAKLLVHKITGGRRGLEADAAAGVLAAIAAKADIINYSHGHRPNVDPPPWLWADTSNVLEDAFRLAEERGIMCVVAAGNCGPAPGSVTRPGGLQSVLTVGAQGLDQRVAPHSGRGPFMRSATLLSGQVVRYDPTYQPVIRVKKPDIVLPGERIASLRALATPRDGAADVQDPIHIEMSGTSQATAVATGLAAALLSLAKRHGISLGANPGRTLRKLFIVAASPLQFGDAQDYGNGTVKWPNLQATLSEFARDPQFKELVLNDSMLRLLEEYPPRLI